MPDRSAEILADREERFRLNREGAAAGKTVLALHANIPGPDKNLPQAHLILEWLRSSLPLSTAEKMLVHEGADGPCYLYTLTEKPALLKALCRRIEETDPLGRFADVDILDEFGNPVSRPEMRKCYLCERPAFVCGREKTHPTDDLVNYLVSETDRYVERFVAETIASAILDELNLDPKFGLVTPTSQGSHPDMDYDLMIRAASAIHPFLVAMFRKGYSGGEEPEELLVSVRKIGVEAEAKMLEATRGINAYKGLIFSLGLILAALGVVLIRHLPFADLFDQVRRMTRRLPDEWNGSGETFGLQVWKDHGFGGARKEAWLGFPSVQKVLPILKKRGKAGLTLALVSLIGSTEDTVLLKRSGSLAAFRQIQGKIGGIRTYDPRIIREITDWCVSQNLSFGGSADLLVVTAFLSRFRERFSFPAEEVGVADTWIPAKKKDFGQDDLG